MYVRDCVLVKEERRSEAKKKDEDHRKGVEMHQAGMMSRCMVPASANFIYL